MIRAIVTPTVEYILKGHMVSIDPTEQVTLEQTLEGLSHEAGCVIHCHHRGDILVEILLMAY